MISLLLRLACTSLINKASKQEASISIPSYPMQKKERMNMFLKVFTWMKIKKAMILHGRNSRRVFVFTKNEHFYKAISLVKLQKKNTICKLPLFYSMHKSIVTLKLKDIP